MTSQNREREAQEDYDEIAEVVIAEWRRIAAWPDLLTDLSSQRVMFVAGGGLVMEFGDETGKIWQALHDKVAVERDELEIAGLSMTRRELEAMAGSATSEIWRAASEVANVRTAKIEIGGVSFARQELEAIGEYYRWVASQKGYYFHCIDERLKDDVKHVEREVHVACGACAAVGQATGLADVEGLLLARSTVGSKQEIYDDMPKHRSLTIFVDFRGSGVVLGSQRRHLRGLDALSFNVSLQTSLLEEYLKRSTFDRDMLLAALVKWNVQLARNIIGGPHNELSPVADKTVLVVDKRGIHEQNPVVRTLTELVHAVDHGETIEIPAAGT